MTEIKRLKKELQEKINKLNACLEDQQLLTEKLKSSTAELQYIKSQIKGVEAFVTYTNEYIYQLQLENQKLKSSCDGWMKRAINLEFKVLNARDVKD